MRQLWYLLKRAWWQRQPFTVLHWRFLLPKQSRAIKLQRFVLLRLYSNYPFIVRFILWLFVQVRWFLWCAIVSIYKSFKSNASSCRELHNICYCQQTLSLLRLSYGYSIPAQCYYDMQLFNQPSKRWLSFVYDFQASAWHSAFINVPQDLLLLRNKLSFSEFFQSKNIATVANLLVLEANSVVSESDIEALPEHFFCKPTQENQSRGCFSIKKNTQTLSVAEFQVKDVMSGQTWSELKVTDLQLFLSNIASRFHRSSKILLQPYLTNQQHLSTLVGEKLVVFRVISTVMMRDDNKFCEVSLAIMQVPLSQTTGYSVPLPVDIRQAKCIVSDFFSDKSDGQVILDKQPMLDKWLSKHWNEIAQLAVNAHEYLDGIMSVGWDIAYTDSGPVLIEGNSHWELEIHQLLDDKPLLEMSLVNSYEAVIG